MNEDAASGPFLEETANIVAAYVSQNPISQSSLPALMYSVHQALNGLATAVQEEKPLVPAVSIKKSITPDHLICLEDGQRYRSMKRVLATRYKLTPDEYRRKWGLPHDYPMVAPNYAKKRSEIAKSLGLGRTRADRSKIRTKKRASA